MRIVIIKFNLTKMKKKVMKFATQALFHSRRYLASMLLLSTSLSSVAATPSNTPKVVAAGGSITEIIYQLGMQQHLVGVDSTSVYPLAAKAKPQIGYVRKLSPEGVLSLSPDILIGEADTGPAKVLKQLQAAKLNIHILAEDDNFAGIENKVTTIAKLLHASAKGKQINQLIQADRAALAHLNEQFTAKPKVLFVLSLRNGQPIVSGTNTSADETMVAAGAINAASDLEGWKPLSTEAAFALNPDVILTMGRAGAHNTDKLTELPHFKYSNAVKSGRIYSINASYLLGMGVNTPKAVIDLALKLHPNAQLPSGYQLNYPPTTN